MTSVLVLGGARSGKSRYAEELLADEPAVRYVATGPVPDRTDDEWATRVAQHRQRRPKHWHTVETADPAAVLADRSGTGHVPILVDCLGTWLTRLIDEAGAWDDGAVADTVRERAGVELVRTLATAVTDVVLVSNEVGSGVVPATPSGRLFRDQLGRLNAQVAAACDRVVLVVAGRVIELPGAGLGPGRATSATGAIPARARVGAPAYRATSPDRPSFLDTARDAGRLAIGTLTAWPVPAPTTVNRRIAGLAMVLAPLVMAPLLALLAVPAVLGAQLGTSPLVLAALLIATLVLSTRGMHLDGLADTCDALSAGYDRERALTVMRTGDVGPSGAAAIALVLLIQTVALADVLGRSPAHLVPVAVAILASRHVLAWGCRRGVPPARPEGLGAAVAGSVSPAPLAVAGLALAGLGALGALAVGIQWWVPLAVVISAVGAALALIARCTRRFGGITGDVLGAAVEVGLASALALAAVLP